jgi:hypothetical protein
LAEETAVAGISEVRHRTADAADIRCAAGNTVIDIACNTYA